VEALDAMSSAKTHVESVAADVAFHEALLSATNNDLLMPFGVLIEETLGNLFDFTTQRNKHYKQALKLHENIAKAVIAGDAAAARKAMLVLIGDTDAVIAAVGKVK
jgi:DNA-binding FadR family transcriptional regulator